MVSDKNVLLISYYFPPIGLGGVQRPSKLAKYLPQCGWNPFILTVKDIYYYQHDASLIEDSSSVTIVRTGSFDPLRLFSFVKKKANRKQYLQSAREGILGKSFRFIDRNLLLPDSKLLWFPFLSLHASKLIEKHKIKAIIATGPPFSALVMAKKIASKHNIPFIADFRDGWSEDDFNNRSNARRQKRNRELEKVVIESASFVTVATQAIKEHIVNLLPAESHKCNVIYNGFDTADFTDTSPDRQKFRLLYSGTITQWSDPSVFFDSLAELLRRNKYLSDDVEIKIIGRTLSTTLAKNVEQFAFRDIVSVVGYIPHDRVVQEMMNSSLLLFPLSGESSSNLVTGKIFEYLYVNVPIIAHVPEGEAKSLLQQHAKKKHFLNEATFHNFEQFVLNEYEAWKKKQSEVDSPYEGEQVNYIDTFDRKLQAKQFARLLEAL